MEPLGKATVICLNKIELGTQALIVNSFKQKWNNARHTGFLGLVCLPYQIEWVDDFIDLERLALQELSPLRHDCYALTTLHSKSEHPLSNCIIWDTPDFDSIKARDYYDSVLKTVAFADIIVLVVSKDKYADQSVWETMALLEPLGKATVICLNKIELDTQPRH